MSKPKRELPHPRQVQWKLDEGQEDEPNPWSRANICGRVMVVHRGDPETWSWGEAGASGISFEVLGYRKRELVARGAAYAYAVTHPTPAWLGGAT